jgi:hypothetical protein
MGPTIFPNTRPIHGPACKAKMLPPKIYRKAQNSKQSNNHILEIAYVRHHNQFRNLVE